MVAVIRRRGSNIAWRRRARSGQKGVLDLGQGLQLGAEVQQHLGILAAHHPEHAGEVGLRAPTAPLGTGFQCEKPGFGQVHQWPQAQVHPVDSFLDGGQVDSGLAVQATLVINPPLDRVAQLQVELPTRARGTGQHHCVQGHGWQRVARYDRRTLDHGTQQQEQHRHSGAHSVAAPRLPCARGLDASTPRRLDASDGKVAGRHLRPVETTSGF